MKNIKISQLKKSSVKSSTPQFLPYFISIFVLTFPLLISSFSAQAANLINSVLTGHFSYIDLAAVSYGFLMVTSIGSISQGAISALMPSMQKSIKNLDGQLLLTTIFTLLSYMIFSVFVFAIFYISVLFLEVSSVYKQAVHAYLVPMFIFLLALQFLSFCVNILIIIEKIKIIALFGLCATIIDIITSSLMVHGIFGLPKLGAQGAALGSMMGSLTVTLLAVLYLKKHFKISAHFKSSNKWIVNKKQWLNQIVILIKLSFPAGLASFLNWAVLFFITFVLTLNDDAEQNIAANQILMVICSIVLVFSKTSGGLLVKKINEFKSIKPMRFLSQIILGYQLFYLLLMAIVLSYFEFFVSLFGVNQSIITSLDPIKWCLLFYVLLSSLDVVLGSYFVSKERNSINFNIQLVSIVILVVGVCVFGLFLSLSLFLLWVVLVAEKLGLVSYKLFKLYQA